jgi:hypothetical protein
MYDSIDSSRDRSHDEGRGRSLDGDGRTVRAGHLPALSIDPDLPAASIRTFGELVGGTLSRRRSSLVLLTIFVVPARRAARVHPMAALRE